MLPFYTLLVESTDQTPDQAKIYVRQFFEQLAEKSDPALKEVIDDLVDLSGLKMRETVAALLSEDLEPSLRHVCDIYREAKMKSILAESQTLTPPGERAIISWPGRR